MTFAEFKRTHDGGIHGVATENIHGFCKKGDRIWQNCDNFIVVEVLYQPLNGIYTVYLAKPKE